MSHTPPPLLWLFDIDGTLIDSGGAGGLAMNAALQDCFDVLPKPGVVSFAGRTDRAIVSDLLEAHQVSSSDENVGQVYRSYMQRLPEALEQCNGRVLPGVLNWLDHLRHRDMALGLVTGNMAAAARKKLEYYGLWDYFAFGGFGDDHVDRADVAMAAFAAAQQELGVNAHPAKTWVVGDTPHDVRCAKTCRFNSIAVGTGGYTEEQLRPDAPNLFLQSLHELEALVKITDNPEGVEPDAGTAG